MADRNDSIDLPVSGGPPARPEPFPFHDLLGLQVLLREQGRSELRLHIDDRHLRDSGIVHGGVFAALLDAGIGLAARSLSPAASRLVTAQLSLNFVRPAVVGDELTVRGDVLHMGKSTVVARAEVRDAADRLIAAGTGTLLVLASLPGPQT
ncbi:MAG: PaaI family thioesterase [Planctomycetaceae bacterium]|nr:PaaI family thioesterase [Planctomycetaceae bacterium]